MNTNTDWLFRAVLVWKRGSKWRMTQNSKNMKSFGSTVRTINNNRNFDFQHFILWRKFLAGPVTKTINKGYRWNLYKREENTWKPTCTNFQKQKLIFYDFWTLNFHVNLSENEKINSSSEKLVYEGLLVTFFSSIKVSSKSEYNTYVIVIQFNVLSEYLIHFFFILSEGKNLGTH